jgi:signal transduction histidine kinase
MRNWSPILYVFCLFIPVLMLVLTGLSYRRQRERELAHLTEFWGSMVVNVVAMLAFATETGPRAALSMLGWLWPLRTFKLVTEDISGVRVLHRWHYLIFGAGAFLTFALGGYGFPFVVFTLPFSLTVGGLGLYVTLASFRRMHRDHLSPLHLAAFLLLGLFFLRRLLYPFWRMDPALTEVGVAAEIFFLVGFAAAGLSCYLEILRIRRGADLERALHDRSEKFLGQSKFSELGMMSAGIAHEINNPLAVIQARTSQLLRIYRNPDKQAEVGEGLNQILTTSERINRTVQGVREFVHQDETAPPQELSLRTLFDDVLVFCGQRMKNHGVSLRLYGLENFTVRGNKIQLEQVILNLLNNSFDAIEFLPDKWIEVSCHEKDGKVQLYFKDSGHGIPREIAVRIMEPFFSTKDIGKGTGLGLALARGIAEKHGGELSYLPTCPHTTFLLELPKTTGQEWGMPLH